MDLEALDGTGARSYVGVREGGAETCHSFCRCLHSNNESEVFIEECVYTYHDLRTEDETRIVLCHTVTWSAGVCDLWALEVKLLLLE